MPDTTSELPDENSELVEVTNIIQELSVKYGIGYDQPDVYEAITAAFILGIKYERDGGDAVRKIINQ